LCLDDWKCIEETNCWPKNPDAFANPHAVFRRYECNPASAELVLSSSLSISVATDSVIASVFGETHLNSIETRSDGHPVDQIRNLAKTLVINLGLFCEELESKPNGEVACIRSGGLDGLADWEHTSATLVGPPSFVADSESSPCSGVGFFRLMITRSETEDLLFSLHLGVYWREIVV